MIRIIFKDGRVILGKNIDRIYVDKQEDFDILIRTEDLDERLPDMGSRKDGEEVSLGI